MIESLCMERQLTETESHDAKSSASSLTPYPICTYEHRKNQKNSRYPLINADKYSMIEHMNNTMTLDEFKTNLTHLDWWYEYSDDMREYRRGANELDRYYKLAETNGPKWRAAYSAEYKARHSCHPPEHRGDP